MSETDTRDPLAPVTSTPSVSFDEKRLKIFPPFSYKLEVLAPAEVKEKRDMATQEIKRWPVKPGQTVGDPQLQIALRVKVLDGPEGVGEERGLWMNKSFAQEGAMARVIRDAAAAAGASGVAAGGILTLTYEREEKPTQKGYSGRKVYSATYEAPNAFAGESEPPF